MKSTIMAGDNVNYVTPQELKEMISLALRSINEDAEMSKKLAPLLIHGSPGLGKSSIVAQVAEELGFQFIDVRLAQMEPCDIRGLPVPNKENKQMDWYVNGQWPRDPNSKGILFLDEITSADRSIQVAAYELILDRRLGSLYKVPDKWYIIAAGNNSTDRAVATTMSSALANRFTHVELRDDVNEWLAYGRGVGFHPAVLGFIQFKPNYLMKMDSENLERGWPSPRSWERASQICNIYNGGVDTMTATDSVFRKMIRGTVGMGAEVEFNAFYRIHRKFDDMYKLMLDSKAMISLPSAHDEKIAMISAMVYMLWRGKNEDETKKLVEGFFRICTQFTSDFALMAMFNALDSNNIEIKRERSRYFLNSKGYSNWKKKHEAAMKASRNPNRFDA